MTSIRRLFLFALATALAGFALSSNAAPPAKIFSLVMSPATVTTSPVTLTAKFANATPTGNSVINTVILTPDPNLTVTGVAFPMGGNQVACPATTVNSSGQTVPVPAGSICVANIPSLMKAGCTPACSWSMTVTVTIANTCSVYTWAGQAFAGNSFNGDVFAFQPAPSSLTTTIKTGCIYTITATSSGPAGSGTISPAGATQVNYGGSQAYTISAASSNYAIVDVKVDGVSQGAITSYTFSNVQADHTIAATFVQKTLTITSAPTSAVAGSAFDVVVGETPGGPTPSMTSDCGATATSSGTPTSTAFSITIASTGVCNITFSATDYTSAQLNNFQVYKGTLYCGDYDSSLGPTDQTTKLLDPDADKAYIIDGGSGWGLRRGLNKDGSPCVKVNYSCDISGGNIATCTWDKASGQAATFKYVFVFPAVNAGADGWPADYHAQVTWHPTPSVSPSWPTWMPALACVNDMFPTTTGSLPTWVLPIIPNVSPYDPSSNPLNTYGPYQPNQLAMVCIAQQGWTSVGTMDGSTSSRPIKVQWWVKVIDEADIRVSGP